ncbi:hypothetical protein E4P43_07400 [Blastococcus sp. TF02A-35]|nr:hypothetical protein E4P43_07400 [Blastococcus sp. TF02A_35]
MPAIEFIGYSHEDAKDRIERYSDLFRHLDYRDDFIFILTGDTTVIGLNGIEQPLVRVRSRYPERIVETVDILRPYEDVETLMIQFHPKLP